MRTTKTTQKVGKSKRKRQREDLIEEEIERAREREREGGGQRKNKNKEHPKQNIENSMLKYWDLSRTLTASTLKISRFVQMMLP